MESLLNLPELLRMALANGAVGFTLRSGLHPVIYSAEGTLNYETQPSTSEDIEELLRRLMGSRERRQFRAKGVVHFRGVFPGGISLLGGAKLEADEIRVELRKMTA